MPRPSFAAGESLGITLMLFVTIFGIAIFVSVVALVLSNHWNERYGDNRY